MLVGKTVTNGCVILKTDRRPDDLTYFIFFYFIKLQLVPLVEAHQVDYCVTLITERSP